MNLEFKYENLKDNAKLMPDNPGVYLYYNDEDKVIYVGKAKNLKKRVLSYFNKNNDNTKTKLLLSNASYIKHIVVETETDALLLENNLIKKYNPKYNVLLKDDKSYPWICIKNEEFPRVFQTRKLIKDGSKYYGPYTSIYLVRTILELFKDIFKLRTCNLNLSQDNILKNKFKLCLEYHIKNCEGPCTNLQSEDEYKLQINQAHHILKGNIHSVKQYLNEMMLANAEKLQFEKSHEIKNKLDILTEYQSKSTVVSSTIEDVDVFSILEEGKFAYINYLKVVSGAIIQVHTIELQKKLEETTEDLLLIAITDILHSKLSGISNAKEIILPFDISFNFTSAKVTVPQIGDKKKLLEMAERNLKYFSLERNKQRSLIDPERHSKRILETIKSDLRLSELPVRIECFDNSNIQGTNPVAACVVFKNAKPAKNEYRKFNIKTVVGPDDFASMQEIVYRRYKRLTEEQADLPQLIIIDGGKGQLNAALNALEQLGLKDKIAIIGIAKKLEEIFFPGDMYPLYLDKNSETLKVIQQARNEAHRFGITFHRDKRSQNFVNSELKNITGIGRQTITNLLTEYKSVKKVSEQSFEQLSKIIGKSKAKLVFEYFSTKN